MKSKYGEITFTDADVLNPDDWSMDWPAWLIHDHGFPVAVVFAESEQDALDEAADRGELEPWELEEGDEEDDERTVYLGNNSKPHDIAPLSIVNLGHIPFSFCALFNAQEARTE